MKKNLIVHILLLFAYVSQAQPTISIKTPANGETPAKENSPARYGRGEVCEY
jgi:hypothetical protein